MDTRKLTADLIITARFGEDNGDNRKERVQEITTNEGAETVAYATSERGAAELVKRWNAFPELVEALRGIIDLASDRADMLHEIADADLEADADEAYRRVQAARAILSKTSNQ